jgi:hypothetical protein
LLFSFAVCLGFGFCFSSSASLGSSFFTGLDSLAIDSRSIFPIICKSIFVLALSSFSSTGTKVTGISVSPVSFFFSVFSAAAGGTESFCSGSIFG